MEHSRPPGIELKPLGANGESINIYVNSKQDVEIKWITL